MVFETVFLMTGLGRLVNKKKEEENEHPYHYSTGSVSHM